MTSEVQSLADVLAAHERPVSAEGMRRAAETLAARDSTRGQRRQRMLERLHQAAPAVSGS